MGIWISPIVSLLLVSLSVNLLAVSGAPSFLGRGDASSWQHSLIHSSSPPIHHQSSSRLSIINQLRGGAKGKDKKSSEKEATGPCIGIDLGTTYSCVAVWRNDRVGAFCCSFILFQNQKSEPKNRILILSSPCLSPLPLLLRLY